MYEEAFLALSRGAAPTGGVDTGETFSTSYDVATKVGILRNVTLNNPTTNGWIPRGVTVVVTDDGASMRERRVREE